MLAESERLLGCFKALGDPQRLRLVALISHGECSVNELTGVLGISQPRVSQHLRVLCAAGILERFRDGQYAFYRLSDARDGARERRQLLALIPHEDPTLERDFARLRDRRGAAVPPGGDPADAGERSLHRELVALTVTAPVGDLLDVGSGRGKLLKLLGSRAKSAVGVDIDADARHVARAEALLAGLDNVTVRQGDMLSLPFRAASFDTIVLDDVIDVDDPVAVLREAARVLRPHGRLLILETLGEQAPVNAGRRLASACRDAGLRLAPPKAVPASYPAWLLAVASAANGSPAVGDETGRSAA